MPQIKGMKSMKKDNFFFQYKYDYKLDARLKKRQGWIRCGFFRGKPQLSPSVFRCLQGTEAQFLR